MAATARSEHHTMLDWPRGTIRNAPINGPMADPTLPPTWNSAWASPCRPPEAIRAMRDASGWKMDDPTPSSPAATSSRANDVANASSIKPASENAMPITREYGMGRRSV